jgi:hypothetical protein
MIENLGGTVRVEGTKENFKERNCGANERVSFKKRCVLVHLLGSRSSGWGNSKLAHDGPLAPPRESKPDHCFTILLLFAADVDSAFTILRSMHGRRSKKPRHDTILTYRLAAALCDRQLPNMSFRSPTDLL